MKRLLGLIIGFALFFPGALVLRWLVVDELGIYQDMTLTDALLAIIIMMAAVLIFGQPRRQLSADELEEQAKKMELASRRLEAAQKAHANALRARRATRRPPSHPAATSRRTQSQPPPPRSSRTTRTDRQRRR